MSKQKIPAEELKVLAHIARVVWQQIGYDVMELEEVGNLGCVEMCFDADRPLSFDGPGSQAICKAAYAKYGFNSVVEAVAKQVKFV
jgi:hypothetical protein